MNGVGSSAGDESVWMSRLVLCSIYFPSGIKERKKVINIPCISYSASPPDSTVPGVAGETRESGKVEACVIDGWVMDCCAVDGCVAVVCVVRTVSAVSIPVDEDTGPGPGEAGPLAYIHSGGRFLGSASAASDSASADLR